MTWKQVLLCYFFAALFVCCCGCGGQSGQSSGQNQSTTNATAVGYVANGTSNTVTSFLVDEVTGALSVASTAPTGVLPSYPAVTPDGHFLFVSNMQDGTISRFVLDGNGGMQSAGTPAHLLDPTGQPFVLATHPSGTFLYAGTEHSVEGFRVDPQTGDLKPILNSPFVLSSRAISLALTHSGQFLYAAGDNSDVIYAFSVDATTGNLTPLSTQPLHSGLALGDLKVDVSDKYLFVTAYLFLEKLLVYNIQSTGALQATTTSPVAIGDGVNMAVAPNGRFLFIEADFDNNILAFSLDSATGAVTPAPGSPFHDGQSPTSVAVSPNSNILVVSRNNPGHVASYRIDPQSGALSPISGAGPTAGILVGDSPNHVLLVRKQ